MSTRNSYSFNNVTISMLGNDDVAGVQKLSYKEKQEKENIYGTRGRVVGRARGRREFEGSMTLIMAEAMQIRQAAGKSSLLDLAPFTMSMSFQEGTNPIETAVFTGVEFLEDGLDLGSEDTNAVLELPIVFTSVTWERDQ